MSKKQFLVLALCFALTSFAMAQKPEEMKNSYYYKRAIELIANDGDVNEALGFLNQELREHPKNGYAYYFIGCLYLDNGKPGDAIEPTNKAISLLHKDKKWLTYAYQQRANINLNLGNEEQALNDWGLALKVNPKDVNTLSDRAEYYYQKDMYAESDADFNKIRALQPGNTLGSMGVGRNALEQGRYDEATELFSYCIKLDPSFSQAYAYRAETYIHRQMFTYAIDDIVSALALDGNDRAYRLISEIGESKVNNLIAKLKVQQLKDPTDNAWPFYLGNIYEGIGKYGKAIESYQEAVKVEESDVIFSRIAHCYNELGDYELAVENIDHAIELDPNDDSYVSTKAEMLYDMGKNKEAIEAYDQFIKLNPDYWGGYYRRGFLKDNGKDMDGAIEDYSTAIFLKPDYAYAYLGRADQYLLKGEIEAAMNDYRMVVALDTVYNEYNCAQYALLELGEKELAKSFQFAVLSNSPSAGNYYDAACLFARMGEKEMSVNFLRNSLEKGFRRFAHINNDDDLDGIRETQSYKDLMTEFEAKYKEEQREKREDAGLRDQRQEHISEIPFTVEGGNCYVKCQINDLPMRFVFDTGASDVSISMVEASFMMKNGYLSGRDVVGSAQYSDANGNVSEGTIINLRKVQFGDLELENVRASVVRNQKAPLLLGQSVLSRVGKIEIDNEKKMIKVKYKK